MNLDIEPGVIFEVPVAACFTLRFATPYTAGELSDATLTLEFVAPDRVTTGAFTGTADGEDMIVEIDETMLTPGLWELNPVIQVGAIIRSWAVATGMNVLARGVSRAPMSSRYSIQ